MNKIVVLFWTLILGQVVGYIGAALSSGEYDFVQVTTISFIVAILIMIIGELALPKKEKISK